MALPLPVSLSPSKVSSFTDCALAFRFSAIDRLPEPPSIAASRGTLVHAALERLFCLDGPERTEPRAQQCLHEAWEALHEHVTQIAEDSWFLQFGLDGWREVWSREAYILRESRVPVEGIESDLFAGIA